MVELLVILDGASEPWDGARPTSLQRARTPALDALARDGELARVRTVPAGLPAGSEAAIPVLLGSVPDAPVDRAHVEAAAHGIALATDGAWRVDVRDEKGARADAAATERAALALAAAAPGHAVHRLAGHRLLLVGPGAAPAAATAAPHLTVWSSGAPVPGGLGPETVVVAARGAAAGLATLMGATVVVPTGATGTPETDLAAKASAAVTALDEGAARVVVHVAGADEAAHVRDAAAKVAFLERADRELVAPLAAACARAGAVLRVCPDHGCDPATGTHDADPVPHLRWDGSGGAGTGGRLTERAVAHLPVDDLTTSLVPA